MKDVVNRCSVQRATCSDAGETVLQHAPADVFGLVTGQVALPHLHRDCAHPCHIYAGTGLTAATSAPGLHRDLGSPLQPPLHLMI